MGRDGMAGLATRAWDTAQAAPVAALNLPVTSQAMASSFSDAMSITKRNFTSA
jgi:hypothetical protein